MRKGLAILSIALLLLIGSAAQAQPIIDFGLIVPTTGTISFAGGANPLVGTNIQVDNVAGVNTPANPSPPAAPLLLTNGALNFTTGAHTGGWSFGGGGTVSIVGGVAALGIADGTTLLTGSFTSAQVDSFPGGIQLLGAGFLNIVNTTLQQHFFPGLAAGFPFNGAINLSFTLSAPAQPGEAFTSGTVLSGDVTTTPIPEPASMVLLGIGAVGAFVGYRRRLKVAA